MAAYSVDYSSVFDVVIPGPTDIVVPETVVVDVVVPELPVFVAVLDGHGRVVSVTDE